MLDKLRQLLLESGRGFASELTQTDKKLDSRFIFAGVCVILSLAAVSIFTYLDGRNQMQNMAYSALTNEQKIISQNIAINALAAVSRDMAVFGQLTGNQSRFNETILMLDNGNEMMGVPPLPAEFSVNQSAIKDLWDGYNKNISTIVAAKPSIEKVEQNATQINESLPELISLSSQLVNDLINTTAPGKNIALASSQLALIRRMENSLNQILNGGVAVVDAAKRFSEDSELIDRQILAMFKGSKSLGIEKFKGASVAVKLVKIAELYTIVKKNADEIVKYSSELIKAHEAARLIQLQSSALLKASNQLAMKIMPTMKARGIATNIAIVFAVLSILAMITLSLSLVRSSRIRLIESQQQNDKNQRAILRLLDEMTNLADGDLSTHTTVTEDITGAIADSVNYSIDALRDLVGTINKTAVQVGSAVRKTQNTTGQLAEASVAQAKEIASAGAAITKISRSMSNISEKANDSAEVARKSVGIAHNGGETVRQTIAGMETIREQIQETSKRIKRLGESSQEIGDIVNLITEISDQTNILALNAAIQASMAGEAGRGFAVVADEVQRLAERTGDATKQIEALVKTIQADTNEATVSMEQSTANVVKGAKLTEKAGSALDRIEQVSMNLAQRILEISDVTKLQASESVKITKSMGVIQQITVKTSEGSGQASGAIGDLSSMVDAMRKSVAGFKLPGMEANLDTLVKEDGRPTAQRAKAS